MKVLVADDSRTMRRVFRTLLESMGYGPSDILESNDAIEALSILKNLKFEVDYIIADLDMPGMENHNLFNSLKRECPSRPIPVLVCINASQRRFAAEAIRHGATDTLERPFRDQDLRSKIQAIEGTLKVKKSKEASAFLKTIVSTAEAEAELPFLMQLPSHIMKEFLQLSSRVMHEAGTIIFQEGESVDSLYVVTLGEIELIPTDGSPAEMCREGEAFGELAFMSSAAADVTARAHSMAQVVSLPRHKLAELISHQPRMSQYLSALVARRSKLLNRAPSGRPESEFAGNLSSMSFADVLQLLQVGRKTGSLELEMNGRRGEIGIESGEVRIARAGDLVGDDAFYTLATWRGASFAFMSSPLKGAPNIGTPTMPLLMEAMRRVDELQRAGEADGGEKSLKELF